MQGSSSNNDSGNTQIPQCDISGNLRNSLWNLIYRIFEKYINYPIAGYDNPKWSEKAQLIVNHIWGDFFKLPSQNIPYDARKLLDEDLYKRFNDMPSDKTYDFLEFLGVDFDKYNIAYNFRIKVNEILEGEGSDRLFVGKKIVKKIDEIEKQSLENAQNTPHDIVNKQIKDAIRLMSYHDDTNCRNSIKESISAIEGLAQIIFKDSGKTLPDLLKKNKLNIHPALQKSLSSIFGYASETCRHSRTEDDKNVTYSDALFIVVVCSAFINYILQKNEEIDEE